MGGHCIGVDPYYLTHKAQSIGYHPEIILAGRRLNDNMSTYVVSQIVKGMIKRRIHVEGSKALIMGLSFKENCPDLRNTKVANVIRELVDYNIDVDVYDPWVSSEDASREYNISPINDPMKAAYDVIVIAVAHQQFKDMGIQVIRGFGKDTHIIYDMKYLFPAEETDLRL